MSTREKPNWNPENIQVKGEKDRCEELVKLPMSRGMDNRKGTFPSNALASDDVPFEIRAESLMGKIPTKESILKCEMLEKLSSQREWKPIRSVLSGAGLYFTKPDDDTIRDLIPLSEIVSVSHNIEANTHSDIKVGSLSSLLDASGNKSHTIHLQTTEKGINCGRSYSLRMPSEESCSDWEAALRSSIDIAARRARAGVSIGRRAQHALRRYARMSRHLTLRFRHSQPTPEPPRPRAPRPH